MATKVYLRADEIKRRFETALMLTGLNVLQFTGIS